MTLAKGFRDIALTDELKVAFLLEPPGWTRLEPQCVSGDPTPGLEARLHDPLWMLCRQWQLGEYAAEDAGSPVAVHVQAQSTPVSGWRPGETGALQPLPPGSLLEATLEREQSASVGLRDRAEAGADLLTQLTELGVDVTRLLASCPLELPWQDPHDQTAAGLLTVLAGRVPDAEKAASSLGNPVSLPPWLTGVPNPAAVLAVLQDWLDWYRGQIAPHPDPALDCWVDERLEYRLGLSVGSQMFEVPAFPGGRLDWHHVEATGSPGAAVAAAPQSMLATPLRFTGQPADRYWEFEDSQVNLGALQVQPHDLARLLLVEFATVYGNDWLVAPVDVPFGSYTELTSVTYTTTFGEELTVARATDAGRSGAFRMFQISVAGSSATLPGLFVPPSSGAVLDGPALEEVLFLRDEMANAAWAVERVVQGPSGDPRSRRDEGFPLAFVPGADPASDLDYQLQNPVPAWWIPFLPYSTGYGTIALAKGAMEGPDGLIEPLGTLLRPGLPQRVRDEEVTREGVRVRRIPTLARQADGTYQRWITRRVGTGRGEGSSGLAFDSTVARRPV